MFGFFLEWNVLKTKGTPESFFAFQDMIVFIFGLVVCLAIYTRNNTKKTFGLDMVVKFILGAKKTTPIIIVKTRVIFFEIEGHCEKILFIRVYSRQV